MKKLFTLTALLIGGITYAQTDNVGIGTMNPDNSAILDLSSSTKGFLLPRMSEAQRLDIAKPAQGLQVFQTDREIGNYTFDGIEWVNSTTAVSAAADPWIGGGNAASPTDFLGTTNSNPLVLKSGNDFAGYFGVYPNTNTFLGYRAGVTNITNSGDGNIAIGSFAMEKNTTGGGNFAVGTFAMRENTTGSSNFALGINSLYNNVSGNYNIGVGPNSLLANTTGSSNLAFGQNSLGSSNGDNNVAIGQNAIYSNTVGNNNLALGSSAGYNNLGTGNIFMGYTAGFNETGDNKLYIANTSSASPLIYGDFSAKYVSIGDVSPAQRTQALGNSGGYNLLVKGGILTEKVKVALASTSDWADYVFDPNYTLLTLEQVEEFTKINNHLPNVPSAEEMAINGIDINETSKMFMEKIEELTLYIIEMDKEIRKLKNNSSN